MSKKCRTVFACVLVALMACSEMAHGQDPNPQPVGLPASISFMGTPTTGNANGKGFITGNGTYTIDDTNGWKVLTVGIIAIPASGGIGNEVSNNTKYDPTKKTWGPLTVNDLPPGSYYAVPNIMVQKDNDNTTVTTIYGAAAQVTIDPFNNTYKAHATIKFDSNYPKSGAQGKFTGQGTFTLDTTNGWQTSSFRFEAIPASGGKLGFTNVTTKSNAWGPNDITGLTSGASYLVYAKMEIMGGTVFQTIYSDVHLLPVQ